jgi:ribulose kinase
MHAAQAHAMTVIDLNMATRAEQVDALEKARTKLRDTLNGRTMPEAHKLHSCAYFNGYRDALVDTGLSIEQYSAALERAYPTNVALYLGALLVAIAELEDALRVIH